MSDHYQSHGGGDRCSPKTLGVCSVFLAEGWNWQTGEPIDECGWDASNKAPLHQYPWVVGVGRFRGLPS